MTKAFILRAAIAAFFLVVLTIAYAASHDRGLVYGLVFGFLLAWVPLLFIEAEERKSP